MLAFSKHNLEITQQYSLTPIERYNKGGLSRARGGGIAGQALKHSVCGCGAGVISQKGMIFISASNEAFFHYATPLGHEKLQTYCVACVKRLESHFIRHCSEFINMTAFLLRWCFNSLCINNI